MTKEELLRRRPVWEAMGDLFLDTETRWSVPFVARRCAESDYDDETLERIFWAEVFPEAIDNLLQVAGEWGMLSLDEAGLIKRANHGSIPWLTRRAHGWMVQDSWLAARQVTGWLRELPEAERETRVRALDLLGRRYFELPESLSLVATPERMNEVLAIAREEWARYEPVCRAMRGDDEKSMPADGCAAAVRKMLAPQ
jgi:hypothetical protein